MRGFGSFGILTISVTLTACASASLVLSGSNGDITVPAHLLQDLETVWKGAHLATAGMTCPAVARPAPVPAALTADLNGDNIPDLIVRAEKDGASRLYAAFARGANEHDLWRVTSGEAPAPSGTVSVRGRGTPFYREGSGLEEFFAVDTVLLNACDGARIAYFWTGNGFEPSRLSDGPAGPPLTLPTGDADTR